MSSQLEARSARGSRAKHPAIEQALAEGPVSSRSISADDLRELALSLGADDAGVVRLDHPELAEERAHAREALPGASALLTIVVRMNRESIRSPLRSVANLEFHQVGERVDEIQRELVRLLEQRGVRALNPAMAFPMEMSRFPQRGWIISHKRVAQAAGLGRMGLHRNVIHPRFGSFILLGTVVLAVDLETEARTLDVDPCVGCNLCVAACPVGAIHPDGRFDFAACYTHNYREFMSGFTDFVETIVESRDRHELREKISQGESASMWQSLSYKPNYKAAYCLAVCPAGSEVLRPYAHDKREHLQRVVEPLLKKEETIYVVAGSDAERHVSKRFPHKAIKRVKNGLRPTSAAHFLRSLPMVFQPGASEGLNAIFHFDFVGNAPLQATVVIREKKVVVSQGLEGHPDVVVHTDEQTWIDILSGKRSAIAAVLTRRLRIRGQRSLLDAFQRCFPS